MVMPAVRCDRCGFASVIAILRVLWMPIDRPVPSGGMGEYTLCADCRNAVLDALQPKKA
jgi:hypothetical protein